jgi:predicted permease
VDGLQISPELFAVLGVSLFEGRTFTREENQRGAAPVAIVSYAFRQRHPDPALVFEGRPYSVVGIAPAGFHLAGEVDADVFTPLEQNTEPNMRNREAQLLNVVARLRPGTTLAAAEAELAFTGRSLAAQYPKANAGLTLKAKSLRRDVVGDTGSTLWLLLGAVGVVLLIACVNIASLLLARAVSREREVAMRVALGAGRSRLVRQCLTESAVLALGGGALGIALAAAGLRPFVVFWPGGLPRADDVGLDWRVLIFALALSLLCGVLFGIAPAWRAGARDPTAVAASRGARSRRGFPPPA